LLLTAEAPCGGALEVTSVILVSSARPALAGPVRERRGRSNRGADRDYIAFHPQTSTVPGCTPWQTTSLETQPASITTFRLSLVIGTGFRNRAFISTLLGPSAHLVAPSTWSSAVPSASWLAICAAALPSSRASFQTETVWVPSAMRFNAA